MAGDKMSSCELCGRKPSVYECMIEGTKMSCDQRNVTRELLEMTPISAPSPAQEQAVATMTRA